MNIFKVLANGDGSINEANVSAFLGYLLDPGEDHSMGSSFLSRFIQHVAGDVDTNRYDYRVFYEQAAVADGRKHVVDLVVVRYETEVGKGKESHLISFLTNYKKISEIYLIENKVRSESLAVDQLVGQRRAFESVLGDSYEGRLFSVYITPDEDKYENEFQKNFHIPTDEKSHIIWNAKPESYKKSICSILTDILREEAAGKVDPIDQYALQTIKAFKQFIESGFRSQVQQEAVRKNDGTYTQTFVELNKKHRIAEKLERLREALDKRGFEFSQPNFKEKRFPKIFLEKNNYKLSLSISPTKPELVKPGFGVARLGSLGDTQAHLLKLASRLGGELRKKNYWDMYISAKTGMEEIPLDELDNICEHVKNYVRIMDEVFESS